MIKIDLSKVTTRRAIGEDGWSPVRITKCVKQPGKNSRQPVIHVEMVTTEEAKVPGVTLYDDLSLQEKAHWAVLGFINAVLDTDHEGGVEGVVEFDEEQAEGVELDVLTYFDKEYKNDKIQQYAAKGKGGAEEAEPQEVAIS